MIPYQSHPSYLNTHQSGELERRARAARRLMAPCRLCPHECGADRTSGELGICRMDDHPRVASWNLHMWEEPPISGSRGSGTIFFSGCTGRCRFCQNYPISQMGHGERITVHRLAEMMLELQEKGAHNINFVTPTHFMPHILEALPAAINAGLRLPIVYNSSGYERVESLRLLESIVDIWLPDAKYANEVRAREVSGFDHYVEHNRATLREIHRQVSAKLILDGDGIACRGMIVRHLVLPHGVADSVEVLRWVAAELGAGVHVSLMDQYFPAHRAIGDPKLGRKLRSEEYEVALQALEEAGLENGWYQSTTSDR